MRIHPIPNSSSRSACAPRITYWALDITKEKTQNKKKLLVTRVKGLRELKAESFYSFRKQLFYSAFPSITWN
jgi:hypothetical protein